VLNFERKLTAEERTTQFEDQLKFTQKEKVYS